MNELFIFPDYCYLLKIYYLLFIMLLFICTFYYDTSYFIFYSSCVSCKSASILFHVLFIMLLSFLSLSLSLYLSDRCLHRKALLVSQKCSRSQLAILLTIKYYFTSMCFAE